MRGNFLRTMRMSVNCPYCGTGFTFRSDDKFRIWKENGRKDPLHAACIDAKKKEKLT
jgi:hypothetical protein